MAGNFIQPMPFLEAGTEREGFNMSDLGEALVSFVGGGGGVGVCAIHGLNRYVPTEGYRFQAVYYGTEFGFQETDQLVEDFSLD